MLVVILLVSVTWMAHSEYLAYKTAIADPSFIGLAYTLKWLATGTILVSYFIHLRFLRSTQSKETSTIENIQVQGDGFDAIRGKAKLMSTTQQMIDSKPDDNIE